MIKMNEGGEVEMIKSCSHIDNSGNNTQGSTPSASRAPTPSRAPKPELLLSEPLKNRLKLKAPQLKSCLGDENRKSYCGR